MPSKHPIPDFVGHLVANGRFLLLELLGAGSYGKVYRVVDTASFKHTEEHYAVKCMHRYRQGSRRDTLQKREFSAHTKVSGHPNVITFHEVFYDRLYLYVVLDLCLGGDLYSAICESRLLHNNDALKSILSNSSMSFNIVMNKVYFTVTSNQRMSCARKAAPRSSLPTLVW